MSINLKGKVNKCADFAKIQFKNHLVAKTTPS